jgi:hypothetical protein
MCSTKCWQSVKIPLIFIKIIPKIFLIILKKKNLYLIERIKPINKIGYISNIVLYLDKTIDNI